MVRKELYLKSDKGSWSIYEYEKVPGEHKEVRVASGLGGIVCVDCFPDDGVS